MGAEGFSGAWRFLHAESDLTWPAPARWEITIAVEGEQILLREAVEERAGARYSVATDARLDDAFYPVTGSRLVDEIAYRLEGDRILGRGRMAGADCLRETTELLTPERLRVRFWLLLPAAEVPIGTAVFERADQRD